MIEIRNLHKAFGDREVLKGITSTFDSGKTNLIIGQSGSGKTVLIKNIVGLFEPTEGFFKMQPCSTLCLCSKM